MSLHISQNDFCPLEGMKAVTYTNIPQTKLFSLKNLFKNMHFGYRVMNEISMYMCNAMKYNTTYPDCTKVAMDRQIMQKVLPKLYGSYDSIWVPLVALLGKLINPDNNWEFDNSDDLINELTSINPDINQLDINGSTAQMISNYPNSVMKIVNMLHDLNTTGFATYLK